MRHLSVLVPLAALAWSAVATATPPTTTTPTTTVPGPRDTVVYRITRDMRRCISPLCGGWWVAPLNHSGMQCRPNAPVEPTCYVADIDWDALGLSDADLDDVLLDPHVLLSGHFEPANYPGFPGMALLVPEHAWTKKMAVTP
jgi:hypothetical protein